MIARPSTGFFQKMTSFVFKFVIIIFVLFLLINYYVCEVINSLFFS